MAIYFRHFDGSWPLVLKNKGAGGAGFEPCPPRKLLSLVVPAIGIAGERSQTASLNRRGDVAPRGCGSTGEPIRRGRQKLAQRAQRPAGPARKHSSGRSP